MATSRIELSGDVTPEELQRVMTANASYQTRRDTVMAENFIDAAEALLVIPLSEMEHSGESARQEIAIVERSRDRALAWLQAERACTATPRHYVPAKDWRSQ